MADPHIKEEYKCLKMPLIRILNTKNGDYVCDVINDAVNRVTSITTKSYMLLRLWVMGSE